MWDDGSSGSLRQPSGHEQILVTKNLYKNKKIDKNRLECQHDAYGTVDAHLYLSIEDYSNQNIWYFQFQFQFLGMRFNDMSSVRPCLTGPNLSIVYLFVHLMFPLFKTESERKLIVRYDQLEYRTKQTN